ncbi:hypothetical protein EDB86DRAFT_2833145 [Lactarius hatsudake]|nr:hypothetical protein EDB86DRAFT_2833145 [Lactarius hatsudake]
MTMPVSFFLGNIDPTLTRDQGNTPYDSCGQWQFEIFSNASAKALEVNGHFIHVKMIADQRATEIKKLQEALSSKTKENDQLTKENDHLNVEVKTLKEALGLFAKDYHNRQGGTSVQAKRKPGRPPRDSEDEEDHSAYFYLENQDGTPVDKSVIAEMSRKAQMLLQDEDHDRDNPNAEEHHSEDSNNDPSEHAKDNDNPNSDTENDNPDARDSEQHTKNGNKTTSSEADGPTLGEMQSTPPCCRWFHSHKTNHSAPTPSASATHGTTMSNGTHPGCVGKKRKPASEGSNTSSTTNKRQKVLNTLAIPTEGNTIKNICMHHWNEEQPRGQGPLLEFDVYFKSLTDANKEDIAPDAPEAFQEGTAQCSGHGRKAKKRATGNDTPSTN